MELENDTILEFHQTTPAELNLIMLLLTMTNAGAGLCRSQEQEAAGLGGSSALRAAVPGLAADRVLRASGTL